MRGPETTRAPAATRGTPHVSCIRRPQANGPADAQELCSHQGRAAQLSSGLVFMLLGSDAGLRCGEIIALEQTDVDLRRGVLHVRQSEWEGHVTLPKSGRGRKVVLAERLAAALAKKPPPPRSARALARGERRQGDPGAARQVDAA